MSTSRRPSRGRVIRLVVGLLLGLAVAAGLVWLLPGWIAPQLFRILPTIGSSASAAPAPRWAPPGDAPAAAVTPGVGNPGRVDPVWVAKVSLATGIPERALAVYAGTAIAKTASTPSCHLSWTTLAGIGEVESDHGRHGGSSVGADFTVSPPIYGPTLDGNGVALIPDSDGGAIDGDPTGDRAVGPMQFIPQTWRLWGTDGNGDGKVDPQNLADATAAAANYLCRASGAQDTETGWRTAIGAYNHTSAYIAQVATASVRYATLAHAVLAPPTPSPSPTPAG